MNPQPSLAWLPTQFYPHLVGSRIYLRGREAILFKIDDVEINNPTFSGILTMELPASEGGELLYYQDIPLEELRFQQPMQDELQRLVRDFESVPLEHRQAAINLDIGPAISALVADEVETLRNKLLRYPREYLEPDDERTLPWVVEEVSRLGRTRPTFIVNQRKDDRTRQLSVHTALQMISPYGELNMW